jgi:hypothetical protein
VQVLEKPDLEKDRPPKYLVNSCTWDVIAPIFMAIHRPGGGGGYANVRFGVKGSFDSLAWLQLCPIEL